jgi:hypothetical protein
VITITGTIKADIFEETSIILMDSCQIVTPNIVDYSTKLIQQTIKNAIGL